MEIIYDFSTKTEDKIRIGYLVNTGAYIRRGWDILQKKMDYFILYTILVLIGTGVSFGAALLFQPLASGILLFVFYLESGKNVRFEDFLDGFKHFTGLLFYTLVAGLIIFLGMLAFVLPGIYLAVSYIFTPFYIIFGKIDFWESMELSRKLVQREWFSIFGFVLVLGVINLLGALAFGIGLFVSIPLSYCALYAAFDDIIGL